MRLKTPATAMNARTVQEKSEERRCTISLCMNGYHSATYLVLSNAPDQHQPPCNKQSLQRIGKRMRLERPGDIRRSHQRHSRLSMTRGRHQLIDRPVLQHKRQQEHDPAKHIVYQLWGWIPRSHLRVVPFQQAHGHVVHRP